MKDSKKIGYSAFNAGSNVSNAAMTELWQSTTEKLLASRDWGLELDVESLSKDIINLAQSILTMATEAMFEEIPQNVTCDCQFDIVCQAGRSLYRGLKYSQLDKLVKGVLLQTFEEKYDLRKTSGQRRWYKGYLTWKKEQEL